MWCEKQNKHLTCLCGAMAFQVKAAAANQNKTTNKLFTKIKTNQNKNKTKTKTTINWCSTHHPPSKFSNCWLLFGKLAPQQAGFACYQIHTCWYLVSLKKDESLWYWYPVAGSGTYRLLLLFYHRALH